MKILNNFKILAGNLGIAGLLVSVSCGGPVPPSYPPDRSAGGGSGGARPTWVDGVSGRYSDVQYLSAVGHGAAQAACESDAYGALAKIFNARIQSESTDWQRHFSQVQNSGAGVTVEMMNVTQLTRVSTDKVLKGARVAEHWDNGADAHHCLAVIERMPAARSLREEIARIDAEMAAHVKRGDEADTPTARFMSYARAMELMQKREALNVDLRIINNRGGGVPPAHGWQALVDKFLSAKGKIKVGLKLKGSKWRTIQTCLVEELTKQGLEVLEGTSDIDLYIHGTLKYEKAGRIAGSQMVRADLNVRVNDVETGRTLSAFSETVKEGRPTLKRAVQLSVTSLCKKISPKLATKIRASFSR